MKWVYRLLATEENVVPTILRLALGIMIFPHGAQKLLGWFGGFGFEGTMSFFTGNLGIPYPLALLAVLAEFLGGLALVAGFFGRVAALGVAGVMVTAVALVNWQNGFFWTNEGIEMHILIVAITVVIMLRGSGAFSVDRWLAARLARPDSEAAPAGRSAADGRRAPVASR